MSTGIDEVKMAFHGLSNLVNEKKISIKETSSLFRVISLITMIAAAISITFTTSRTIATLNVAFVLVGWDLLTIGSNLKKMDESFIQSLLSCTPTQFNARLTKGTCFVQWLPSESTNCLYEEFFSL